MFKKLAQKFPNHAIAWAESRYAKDSDVGRRLVDGTVEFYPAAGWWLIDHGVYHRARCDSTSIMGEMPVNPLPPIALDLTDTHRYSKSEVILNIDYRLEA
jgi:hypothetical protein